MNLKENAAQICGERFLPPPRKGRIEMNNSKQETISDIVAEMRRLNPEKFLSTPWYCEPLPNRMRSYADRIEEAAKREREARDEMARSDIDSVCAKYGRLVKKLRSENERLLSALKPVQDAYMPAGRIGTTGFIHSKIKSAIFVHSLSARNGNPSATSKNEAR